MTRIAVCRCTTPECRLGGQLRSGQHCVPVAGPFNAQRSARYTYVLYGHSSYSEQANDNGRCRLKGRRGVEAEAPQSPALQTTVDFICIRLKIK